MVLALVAAHVSSAYAKKASNARARQRRVIFGVALTLGLILSAIPWPGTAAARPLLHWI